MDEQKKSFQKNQKVEIINTKKLRKKTKVKQNRKIKKNKKIK